MGANYTRDVLTAGGARVQSNWTSDGGLRMGPFVLRLHKASVSLSDDRAAKSAEVFIDEGSVHLHADGHSVSVDVVSVGGGRAFCVVHYHNSVRTCYVGYEVLDEPDGDGIAPDYEMVELLFVRDKEAAVALAATLRVAVPSKDDAMLMAIRASRFDGTRFEKEPSVVLSEMEAGYEVLVDNAVKKSVAAEDERQRMTKRLAQVRAMRNAIEKAG